MQAAIIRLAVSNLYVFGLLLLAFIHGHQLLTPKYAAVHFWTLLNLVIMEYRCVRSLVASAILTVRQWKADTIMASLSRPEVDSVSVGADDVCPICYGEMTSSHPDSVGLTACGHMFHRECLAQWLPIQASCPVCRKQL